MSPARTPRRRGFATGTSRPRCTIASSSASRAAAVPASTWSVATGMPPTAFTPVAAVGPVAAGRGRGGESRGGGAQARASATAGSSGCDRRVQGGLVLAHRAEDREPGGRRERPGRGVGRDDVQPAAVDHGLAGEQPEVDPRRRHAGPERDHQGHPGVVRLADAVGGGRDLVVGVQVDDRGHVARLDLHRPQDAAQRGVERDPRRSGSRWPARRGPAASRPAGRPGAPWRRRSPRPGRAP